ncbi:MAG: dockerin type I repeat-containing protein [Gemmatales bacterium]
MPHIPVPVSTNISQQFQPPTNPFQAWIQDITKDLQFDGIIGEPTLDEINSIVQPADCNGKCEPLRQCAIQSVNLLNSMKQDLIEAKDRVAHSLGDLVAAAGKEFLVLAGTLAGIAVSILEIGALLAVEGEALVLGSFKLTGSTAREATEAAAKSIFSPGEGVKLVNTIAGFINDVKSIFDQAKKAGEAHDLNSLRNPLDGLPKLMIAAASLFIGPSKFGLTYNGYKSGTVALDWSLRAFDWTKLYSKILDLGLSVVAFKETKDTAGALDDNHKTLKNVIANYKAQVIRARQAVNDYRNCTLNCDDETPDPKDLNKPDDKQDGKPVGSRDPNEKLGAGGFGTQRFVQPGSLLPYTVYFENAPTLATAPAQEVFIDDQLDADADWSTFEFGNVGFGDQVIQVPAGLQEYQTRIDYHNVDGSALQVDVSMKLDRATGKIHWSFRSVDPISGALPNGVQDGFLPVNDETGRGEGFVRYTVRAKTGLATGTTIQNKATIVFDENDPISTNTVVNTIDANAPTSGITALPALTANTTFTVNWSGSDGSGAGIVKYNVYISIDNSPFTLWLKDTTATSANYTGVRGSRYAFYSVATDGVDFVQTKPLAAQASTLISLDTKPQVDHVVFNKGDAQRSKVFYIQVVFNSIVKVDKTSFDLFLNNRRFVVSNVSSQTIDGQTWATLQFPASSLPALSVPEGQFRLVTKAKGVKNAQGQTMQADRTDSFFRLYGDTNGDGQVNAADVAIFNAAFGKKAGQQGYLWYLDWNNDGKINDIDRRVFQTRIGRHT